MATTPPTRYLGLWLALLLLIASALPTLAQKEPAGTPTPQTTPDTPTPESTPETPEAPAEPTPEPMPTPKPPDTSIPGIWISDSDNSRVVFVEDMEGNGYRVLGFPGHGPGRFLHPSQVWVDHKGRLYVADTDNNRIVRVDEMTGRGWTEMNGFSAPEGVASKTDELYVADTGNNQVLVYSDMNGELLRKYDDPRLAHPVRLWLDQAGDLYVACGQDPPGGRVVKLVEPKDPTGEKWQVYSGEQLKASGFAPSQPLTIKGSLLATDSASHRLIKVDNFQGRSPHELGGYGRTKGKLQNPMGAALDKQGHIYIADTGNDRIIRIDNVYGANWTEYTGRPDKTAIALRAPESVFVWSPAPPPPPPPKEDKKKKK